MENTMKTFRTMMIMMTMVTSAYAGTCEQDFREAIQKARSVDHVTNNAFAGIEIETEVTYEIEDVISEFESIEASCEGSIKKEASEFVAYFNQRKGNAEQEADNKNFEKNASCYGYSYCPNGMQVSCTSYGQGCHWNAYPGGVQCVGYDWSGNRIVTYGRCW